MLLIEYSNIVLSGQTYLKESAQELLDIQTDSNRRSLINTDFHNQLGFNYIICQKNKIIKTDSKNNKLNERIINLIDNDDSFRTIEFEKFFYRVYQLDFTDKKQKETLYVFQNIIGEQEIIESLVKNSIIIGFVAIFGLILICFWLTKISLKTIERNYEKQNEFLADVSHELRSPLNVIQTNVELLLFKEKETIRANKKWFQNIVSETQTMSHLVEDLMEVVKDDNEQQVYLDRDLLLNDLLDEIIFLLKSSAKEKNIELVSNIQKELRYYGDSEKLRQLFRIFIDNAIKYSIPNSKVEVFLKEDNDYIVFTVKDNGIGIKESEQKKIFERFYRCDNARSRKFKGTGLGLNIANNIVNNYEGTIEVNSKLNKGSTFIIKLPL